MFHVLDLPAWVGHSGRKIALGNGQDKQACELRTKLPAGSSEKSWDKRPANQMLVRSESVSTSPMPHCKRQGFVHDMAKS
jgi:hypothetical protein